jgi:hypothetical protein
MIRTLDTLRTPSASVTLAAGESGVAAITNGVVPRVFLDDGRTVPIGTIALQSGLRLIDRAGATDVCFQTETRTDRFPECRTIQCSDAGAISADPSLLWTVDPGLQLLDLNVGASDAGVPQAQAVFAATPNAFVRCDGPFSPAASRPTSCQRLGLGLALDTRMVSAVVSGSTFIAWRRPTPSGYPIGRWDRLTAGLPSESIVGSAGVSLGGLPSLALTLAPEYGFAWVVIGVERDLGFLRYPSDGRWATEPWSAAPAPSAANRQVAAPRLVRVVSSSVPGADGLEHAVLSTGESGILPGRPALFVDVLQFSCPRPAPDR